MAKTVAEHIQEADQIKKHVADANALVARLQKITAEARSTLEALKKFAPQEHFQIDIPYHLRSERDSVGSMLSILDRQIKGINAILGDRA